MSNIKPNKRPTFNESIAKSKENVKLSTEQLVNFSFKYLTEKPDKFIYKSHGGEYYITLICRLKDICHMKIGDLLTNHDKGLRAHPIIWEETSERAFGLPAENELVEKPYQFSLSSNEHGRIIGFIINTRFYIVWFDKGHELYP